PSGLDRWADSPERGRSSERPDVRRLESLLALLDLEFDGLTLFESPVPAHLDGGVVDEHVRAVTLRDEAEALLRVEPLHCSGRHVGEPPSFDAVCRAESPCGWHRRRSHPLALQGSTNFTCVEVAPRHASSLASRYQDNLPASRENASSARRVS